jgi:EmrB/QacA subfamily drug resistance transporter
MERAGSRTGLSAEQEGPGARPDPPRIEPAGERIALRSRLGLAILVLLGAVQFLDLVDASIVNVALPSIQRSLGFSQQNLQWVASGYLITYGGFLLLGGRLGDILGRRRLLTAGVVVFAIASLSGGLAGSQGLLIAARLVQGAGAAMMAPAALSELTTTFREGKDRNTALGVWGAISGIAAAAGVFLGGVLAQGPGWRWVLFVNPPVCVAVLIGAFALLRGGPGRRGTAGFDSQGAALVTAAVLLGVYALVRAPDAGWGSAPNILMLAGSVILLAVFILNEVRSRNPLVPLAILRVKGVAAADATQLIAFAGVFAMIFFVTLYMQEVLHYSPLRAGAAYLPITAAFAVAGGVAAQLVTRVGSRPVVVVGALTGAAGIYYLSRVPLRGSYLTDLLPGFLVMALGLGAVFVAVAAAANAGVPAGQAGLAAGLLNASQQVGSALGLAVLSSVAISRTNHLLAARDPRLAALDAGYHRGLLVAAIALTCAAAIALRIGNTSGPAPLVLASADADGGGIGSHPARTPDAP